MIMDMHIVGWAAYGGFVSPHTFGKLCVLPKSSEAECDIMTSLCRVRPMANKKQETYRDNPKRNKLKTCTL